MLKLTYVSVYRKGGKNVFVYDLSGKQELIDLFVSKSYWGCLPITEDGVRFQTSQSLGLGTFDVELTLDGKLTGPNLLSFPMNSDPQGVRDLIFKAAFEGMWD